MDNTLADKTAGALLGYAIGDTLGRGTELMSRREVLRRYPDGLTDYDRTVRDAHRANYPRGHWTGDTDVILSLVDQINAHGDFDWHHYAHNLKQWYLANPYNVPSHLRWVLGTQEYEEAPEDTAVRIWEKLGDCSNPNDPIGRALVAGMWGGDVIANAVAGCRLTHPQPVCLAGCAVTAVMADNLMRHGQPATPEDLKRIAAAYSDDLDAFIDLARNAPIEDQELDNEEDAWAMRKTIGSAFWAVWHCDNPTDGLNVLVSQGGDAAVNASLGHALLGLQHGASALSPRLVQTLRGHEEIEARAEKLARTIQRHLNATAR